MEAGSLGELGPRPGTAIATSVDGKYPVIAVAILAPDLTGACARPVPDAAACPATVQAEQRAALPPPAGWAVATDGDASHTLSGVTFFSGPPERGASLVGDERPAGKGRIVATWQLSASETYWVVCSYVRTSVVLQRELPPGLKSCALTYVTQVRVGGLPQGPEDRVPLSAPVASKRIGRLARRLCQGFALAVGVRNEPWDAHQREPCALTRRAARRVGKRDLPHHQLKLMKALKAVVELLPSKPDVEPR